MASCTAIQQRQRLTRRGLRCSISSTSKFCGTDGRDLSLPLRRGCNYCLAHLPILVRQPCVLTDTLLLYLDFETSGLNVFADHIVEFGVLSERGECFSTVCCPPVLTPGPHVHGIANGELLAGPSFSDAFRRMVVFVHTLLFNCVQSDSSSEDELAPTRFKDHPPDVVVVAHNGIKFDFPFLLSECYRNSVVWEDISTWKFVDTLDVVRALDPEVYGGCQKLQCLLQRVDCFDLQAHRALDC